MPSLDEWNLAMTTATAILLLAGFVFTLWQQFWSRPVPTVSLLPKDSRFAAYAGHMLNLEVRNPTARTVEHAVLDLKIEWSGGTRELDIAPRDDGILADFQVRRAHRPCVFKLEPRQSLAVQISLENATRILIPPCKLIATVHSGYRARKTVMELSGSWENLQVDGQPVETH